MKHPHDNDDLSIPSPEPGQKDLREEGINVGKPGFYDPNRGAKKVKTQKPEPAYGPLLATDPGQPDNIEARGIRRTPAIDKSDSSVLDSKDKPVRVTGRKATSPKD